MSSIAAKAYLSQAFYLDRRINSKLVQAQSYRELATKTTGTMAETPRSGSPDVQPMAGFVAKLIDLENEINTDVDALIDLKQQIVKVIEQVENQEYQLVLELRYLCFRSWDQITVDMNYSARWAHIVHSRALDAVEAVIQAHAAGEC